MVLGVLDQLQIFLQLYLIELLGLLTGLELLELWHLIHPRLLTGLAVLWNYRSDIWPYFFFFLSNRQLQVAVDVKLSQEYLVKAGVTQGWILGPTLFQLYINDLLMMLCVIFLSMLMIPLSIPSVIRHLICGSNMNWLHSELESDLEGTVDWGKKWFVNFNARKTQLVIHLIGLITLVLLM